MSEGSFFNVSVFCLPEDQDLVYEALVRLGAGCVTSTLNEDGVTLTALTEDPGVFLTHFKEAVVSPVVDWEHRWLEYYEGGDLTSGFFVTMPGGRVQDNSVTPLYIDPTSAFGDGRHATTQLCALLLTRLSNLGAVLDIGTGTGVLAILAEKLGADSVEACDIDPASVEKARSNAVLNQCDHVHVFEADILSYSFDHTFDVVVANLLTSVIERALDTIIGLCKVGGHLMFSGIGVAWKEDVTALFEERELVILECLEKDGWLAFLCTLASKK